MQIGHDFGFYLRQIVLLTGAALGTETEAVVFDLEKSDGVGGLGQGFIEN